MSFLCNSRKHLGFIADMEGSLHVISWFIKRKTVSIKSPLASVRVEICTSKGYFVDNVPVHNKSEILITGETAWNIRISIQVGERVKQKVDQKVITELRDGCTSWRNVLRACC